MQQYGQVAHHIKRITVNKINKDGFLVQPPSSPQENHTFELHTYIQDKAKSSLINYKQIK